MTPDALAAALADRYAIERELGRGGMAIVYLARDLRHDRPVALKVVRPELAAIVTTERFLQEIRIAAKLSHPHILPLHDSGEAGGMVYYVMPFIEGESLKQRLAREGRLPVRDALRIAREVADALDYAHRHGIAHRDVKPENILLSDGQAVIADFGIARAMGEAVTEPLTITGLIVGTAEYMSPEQAAGDREIDGRSDVYSLGCVLYAMLAGQPPFTGATQQAVIAQRITNDAPSLRTRCPDVPLLLEQLVRKALEREPANRLQTAGGFARALEGKQEEERRARPPRTWRLWRSISIGAAVAGLAGWSLTIITAPRAPAIEHTSQLTYAPELEYDPALSPNGTLLAYGAGRYRLSGRLHVRAVRGGHATTLTDSTIQTPMRPVWSPDGSRIAFFAADGIYIVSALGGGLRRVVERKRNPRLSFTRPSVHSPSWSPDGEVLAYATDSAVIALHVDSNTSRVIGRAREPYALSWSHDGKWIAYSSGRSEVTAASYLSVGAICIMRVVDGRVIQLTDRRGTTNSPMWMPDDRSILFVSTRAGIAGIYWLPLKSDRTARSGPVPLAGGARASSITLSSDGRTLAYATFRPVRNVWQVSIDPRRTQSMVDAAPVTRGDQLIATFAVTRDGRWLAYDSHLAGNRDIYRVPLSGGEPDRLTDDPEDDLMPSWSRDGAEIAFQSRRHGSHDVFVANADGTNLRRVTSTSGDERTPDWSPDGNRLAYAGQDGLYIVERASRSGAFGPPRRILVGRVTSSRWSPDGRYIAFVAPDGSPRVVRSDGGDARTLWSDTMVGSAARPEEFRGAWLDWSKDGGALFYRAVQGAAGSNIWAISFSSAAPHLLFAESDPPHVYGPAISADTSRLYFDAGWNESDIWLVSLRKD